MGSPLAARLSRFLVRCHPPRWRQRYAAEVLEVLGQHRPTGRTVLNLLASAGRARLDPAWRAGRNGGPVVRLRRWTPVLAVVGVAVLLPAGFLGLGALKEMYGPPMPISGGLYGAAFSPDGRAVAVIGPGLEVWNITDRAHPKLAAYTHGDDTVGGADPAFSPDGRVLAAGGGAVTLWNVADPARLTQIALLPAPVGKTGQVNVVAFTPDGRTLAGGLTDGTVVLWDVADPARATLVTTLTGQARGVSAVSFSPDGRLLASGSDGGTVVVRDVTDPAAPVITATLRFTIAPPRFPGIATGPDVALAFSASGGTLTTIADNTAVTLWNVTSAGAASRVATITGTSIGAGEVAFSPGGRIVAGAPAAGDSLTLWTLRWP